MSVHKFSAATDLEDLALELGASVRYTDGKVFNSSGRTGVTRLPRVKEQPPVPPPAPPQDNAALLKTIEGLLARQPAAVTPVIHMPEPLPAQVVVNALPRTSWDFEFTHNADGSIKTMTARPR